MSRPLVGLALIAKDEETRLPTLLKSIEHVFDRIVLLDTGSTDQTIKLFQDWASKQTGLTYSIGKYEWKHDFSDARNAADFLLLYGPPEGYFDGMRPLVDWKCWADCDDELVGAQNISQIVANVPDGVHYLFAGYQYAIHPESGQCVCYLERERLVRVPFGKWIGRVHEAQVVDAGMMRIPREHLEYIHRKELTQETSQGSNDRNLEILLKWNEDEPDVPRIVGYIGTELQVKSLHEESCEWFSKYAALDADWDEERAQIYRKWAQSLFHLGKTSEAMELGYRAMGVLPNWTDNYLTLAEGCMMKGEWSKAYDWAKRAYELGQPNTMLIINPTDYTFLPLKIMAGAAAEQGRIEEATELGAEALAIGEDAHLESMFRGWQGIAKREHTAKTFVMCVEQLINHDEQFKALKLIEECVPYFAMEHPKVVQLKTFLRTRLKWVHSAEDFEEHYETGGSKPEDFISDENIDPLCEYLPRTNFLLANLLEQHEA